jgi:hypothetical protein
MQGVPGVVGIAAVDPVDVVVEVEGVVEVAEGVVEVVEDVVVAVDDVVVVDYLCIYMLFSYQTYKRGNRRLCKVEA